MFLRKKYDIILKDLLIEEVKMEYRKFDDTYVVRLNKGEEVIESLKDLCKNENIELAEITGLGASNLVEIGVFNVNTK